MTSFVILKLIVCNFLPWAASVHVVLRNVW